MLPSGSLEPLAEKATVSGTVPLAGTGLRPDDFRPGAGRARMTRSELAEAAGELTDAGALSLARAYLESQECPSDEIE